MHLVGTIPGTLGRAIRYLFVLVIGIFLLKIFFTTDFRQGVFLYGLIGASLGMGGLFCFDALMSKYARLLLRQHFENSADLYFVVDHDLKIKFANHKAHDWSGERTLNGLSLGAVLSREIAGMQFVLTNLPKSLVKTAQIQREFETFRGRWQMDSTRWSSHLFLISLRLFDRAEIDMTRAVPWVRIHQESGRIVTLNQEAINLFGDKKTSLEDILPKSISWGLPVLLTGTKQQVIPMCSPKDGDTFDLFLFPFENVKMSMDWSNHTEFDDFPVALLKLGPSGEVQRANHAARDLFEREFDKKENIAGILERLGRSIPDWLEDTFQDRSNGHPEFLRLRRRDKEVFVQVALSKVKQSGDPALFAVVSDATELKTLEAHFVQSQKMQAIGQLAGGVAHDFNNLLTAITGHCDLLLLRHDQSDGDYADLMQINQNANRAAALVGQLLAFSRKQTLRPEVLDLRATLADLTHLLNRLVGEKVQLGLFHHPDLASIRADKRQLEQVILNLVVNARDAMPEGG
jgi:two-component system cell cycle sensor histidine kinase/response regulator CckA